MNSESHQGPMGSATPHEISISPAKTSSGEASAVAGSDIAGWLGFLIQANDSYYPTGSYAHSFGLEGLIQANLVSDRESLREFVFASVIPSLRQNELPIAVHAGRAFSQEDWATIGTLSTLTSALKSAREARVATENIGRQRAELCLRLHGHALAKEYLEQVQRYQWPFSSAISAALEGKVHGAPIEATLVSIYYSTLAAVIAAAMKLLRIGQNGAQTLLTEAMSHAAETIARASLIPLAEIGWFNPWLDIAAARHETAGARLFIS